jgi:PAS domain S-box-containing protein
LVLRSTTEIDEFTENILNTVREPLLVLDKDLRVISTNHSFYNFFKVTPDETIGTLLYDLGNHHWDIPKLKELLEKLLTEKTSIDNYQIEHDFNGIGNRILILNARQIERATGKEKIILLAFEDFTEPRNSEKKVRVGEEEFREIIEHSADAIFIVDNKGRYLYINAKAVQLLGYSKEEMLLFKIGDISPKNKLEEYFEIFKQTLQQGSFFAEIQLIKKDGNLLTTDLNTALLPNGHIYGSCRDITNRKIVEESLRESHQITEEIINSIPVRVFWKDRNLTYLGCNNLFTKDAGFTNPKEIIGKDDFQMGWSDQAELYRDDDRKVIESGKSKLHIEEPQTTPEGNEITLLTSKIPLRNFVGEIIGVLGVYIDITERKQIEASLKTSEERFRTVAGNLTDVIYEWDMKDKLDWYGDIDSISGYEHGEFPRTIQGWEALIHPDDKLRTMTALENHIKGAARYNTEYRIKTNDGGWRWWSARGTALRNDQGKPYKMIGSITDITEQKDIQNKIKFKSDLLSHIGQALIATDLQGKVIYWNNVAEEIYGWSSTEAIGQNIVDLTPIEQVKEHATNILKDLSEGKSWSGEFLVKRKDGSVFPAYVTDAPLIDSYGKLIGIIGISSDITERKQAAEALSNERSLLRTIIDLIPDAIYAVDIEGRKILANAKEIELSGKNSEDEVIGKTDFDLYPESEAQRYYEEDQIIIQSGKPTLNMEDTLISKDGQTHWILGSKVPLRDVHGQITGIVGVNHDITERKQAELIIQQQNNRLQELNATKDKFFSIIAHDLKSPLNGFLNLTTLMADKTEKLSLDEFAEYSKMLNKAARNIYMLLDNLLEWSQIQKGSITFNPKISDLYELVLESIDTIHQSALQKRITLINEINTPQKVYADEKSIKTVLRNLLTNAIKFTRMDGKIVFKSKRLDDSTFQISIQDNGVGIADDDIEKLFRIEEKVSSLGTEGEPSSGLGLLLCKEFVEMHGQKIWAESEINKGSTFSFTLREEK